MIVAASMSRKGSDTASSARRTAFRLLCVLVTVAAIAYVAFRFGIGEIVGRFTAIDAIFYVPIFLALLVNLVLVTLRLHRILGHFGAALPFRTTVRASLGGLLASLFLINLVGSVLGRQLVLRHAGVSVAVVSMISFYERLLLALVGAGLFLAGALVLVGAAGVATLVFDLPLLPMLLAVGLATILTVALSRTPFELDVLRRLRTLRNAARLAETILITLAAQALVLSTYVVAVAALGHTIDLVLLVAAAAVVSFAASLPISVNGWGIREIAAVFAFGAVGVPAADAIAVSVLVGICSTVAVLVAAPLLLDRRPVRPAVAAGGEIRSGTSSLAPDPQKLLALIAGLGAGILVFFQLPVSAGGAVSTLNLADPLALVGLALVVAAALWSRRMPFRVSRPVIYWLAGLTLLLVLTLVIGTVRFGATPWAFGNRATGWLVLLGYLACGALIAGQFGDHGRRRLVQAVAATAVCVLVVHLGHRLALTQGLVSLPVTMNFDGFSANRNAFAFQLAAAAAVWQAYLLPVRRAGWWPVAILVLLCLGVVATGSLTGIAAVAMLGLLALLIRPALRFWLVLVLGGVLAVFVGEGILSGWQPAAETARTLVGEIRYSAESVAIRWSSITGGVALWLQHPLFGAGLGAFMVGAMSATGEPLVIHSTYVWILAEAGLVGLVVVAWLPVLAAVRLCRSISFGTRRPVLGIGRRRLALLGLVLAFLVFSLAHEVAYQRIFWLLAGMLLALPPRAGGVEQEPPGDR